jgi:beta-glucosidase
MPGALLLSLLLATVHPQIWPAGKQPARDAKIEKAIDDLLRTMTLEEKVGQVIQPSITAITPQEVRDYHIGSILNGGGGWPGDVRKAKPQDWLAMADSFYEASMSGSHPIPVMWGADAVHGHNNIIGATIFPHNIGLGATGDGQLIRRIGEVTATEMAVTGIDWDFSPTVAVVQDVRWGRSYESYSQDPAIVRMAAKNMVAGLQSEPHKIFATAKHFLGDGGTAGGKDQGDNPASERQLRDIHLAGYLGAMSSDVQAIMVSFSSWQGEKMHGNRALLTEVLKNRMKFDGLLVGDWNAHGQVPGCTNSSCPKSFNAGLDIFMVPDDWKGLYDNTFAQVSDGTIPMSRLDDAVRRILRVKMRAGLFTAGKPSARPLGGHFQELGSRAHRDVARQAVRESLVLLKNNDRTLPLEAKLNVLVAGDGADNIGKQCGGWTITWQGDGNSNSDFPGGTSIFEGIRRRVEAAGGKATLAIDGAFTEKPDVAIVVFGENPYAEFSGDRPDIVYDRPEDLAILRKLHDAGVRVVSVFISGRPLWMNPYLNASDAFVAAWLPGTEGDGVADVLFGSADFRGKLSFAWQRLFPVGYGLTYKSRKDLPQLSTDAPRAVTAAWTIEGAVVRPSHVMDLSREANGGIAMQLDIKGMATKMLLRNRDIAPLIRNGQATIPLRCLGDLNHVDAFRIESDPPVTIEGFRLIAPVEPLPCPDH